MEKVIRTLSSQGLIPSGDVFMLRSVTGPSHEPVLKHQVPTAFTLFLVHPAPPPPVQGPLSMFPLKASRFMHIRTPDSIVLFFCKSNIYMFTS